MASLRPVAILVFGFLALSVQQDNGTSEGITCYDWLGNGYTNNTQCPGSRVCCNTADLCTPNRFCVANGQTIVPACAVYPWSDCANICQYVTGTGFLPRVVTCSDGSFCCDNDPECCAENRGIVLNGLGAIVSTDGGITSTLTSTALPTSTSSATISTTSSTTTTAPSTSSLAMPTSIKSPFSQQSASTSGLGSGAKAGIGIGAVVFLVALAVVAYLVWAHRKRSQKVKACPTTVVYRHELDHSESGLKPYSVPYTQQTYSRPVEKPATSSALYEMPGQGTPRM